MCYTGLLPVFPTYVTWLNRQPIYRLKDVLYAPHRLCTKETHFMKNSARNRVDRCLQKYWPGTLLIRFRKWVPFSSHTRKCFRKYWYIHIGLDVLQQTCGKGHHEHTFMFVVIWMNSMCTAQISKQYHLSTSTGELGCFWAKDSCIFADMLTSKSLHEGNATWIYCTTGHFSPCHW